MFTPIGRILPDYPTHPSQYELSPHDRHPNALAYQRIADYVVQQILPGSEVSSLNAMKLKLNRSP